MADKKISELTNITGANLADADEFVVVDTSANETKAITYGELKKFTGDVTVSGAITATGGDLATLDLSAIDTSIADTAVDVFVYDTSKDSDGGAWRKRTQHTSWYNETLNTATRGSRREFPAMAVIVAEAFKVTIYDGDDPALPMWVVFNRSTTSGVSTNATMIGDSSQVLTSVSCKNGVLCSSGTNGFTSVNFVSDGGIFRGAVSARIFAGSISSRNDEVGFPTITSGTIVNPTINDVAMTVLPDAPIDPATGLPVPTIAVATAGGVSVIKDDGTVVDITAANSTYGLSRQVHIDRQQGLWFELGNSSQNGGSWVYYFATMPSADTTLTQDSKVGTGADATAYFTDVLGYGDLQYLGDGGFFSSDVILSEGVIGGKGTRAKGLNRVSVNATTPSEGMVAYTTSTYNTGWMNGDIKGAFLSSTDTASLVGSGELVTNGTFDTDSDWTKGTGWTISGGVLNATAAAQNTVASQDITTVVGQTYTVTVDITVSLGTFRFYITEGGTAKANTDNVTVVDDGKYVLTWTATSTTATIKPYSWGASGNSGTFDNISVKLADPDRSVNNNGLIVNGTITRTFVDEV